MRDPVYENDVPLESPEDWDAQITCLVHLPELYVPVIDSESVPGRFYRCARCLEALFEVPR
jgi:hypothetical protein